MPTTQELQDWKGQKLVGDDGSKIGTIEDVYVDTDTDRPEWLAVTTGLFGNNISFVPLAEAHASADGVQVPYDKETVKDAPHADPDGALSHQEEDALYAHYGVGNGGAGHTAGTTGDDVGDRGDLSGPNTDDAMTRSEEELEVGKTQRETGRARLKKYVVTENVTQTVPVQREEVRVEREPITDANAGAATDGPAISEEEHEVTLHAEEPVAEKRVVPKERVRLDKDVVQEEQTVSDDVRKEQIDIDEGRS